MAPKETGTDRQQFPARTDRRDAWRLRGKMDRRDAAVFCALYFAVGVGFGPAYRAQVDQAADDLSAAARSVAHVITPPHSAAQRRGLVHRGQHVAVRAPRVIE